MSLVECRSAAEVLENYKAVRDRVRNWGKPPEAVPIAEVIETAPSLNAEPAPFIPPIPKKTAFVSFEPAIPLPLSITAILHAVALSFGVSPLDIRSPQRTHKIVVPRHVVMHLARKLTSRSLNEIGRAMGGKDHTSIIHGSRKIAKRRHDDPKFDQKISEIEAELTGVGFINP